MAIEICRLNEYNHKFRYFIICILQIMTICNAIKDGWKVKKIGNKTYEFTKKVQDDDDIDLDEFINRITSF